MIKYNWALNQQKLARAIGTEGVDAKEEDIKKAYIEIGGLLANEDKTMENEIIPEVTSETTATETVVEMSEVTASEEPIAENLEQVETPAEETINE